MERSISVMQAVGQRLLLAFKGKDAPSSEILRALKEYRPAGITLFRSLNMEDPAQVRSLISALQHSARELGLAPLLIATDQEGGQLMALGAGTPLPGNMALGAAGSEELAGLAGEVLGRELAAVGVNVNYAPCVDVNVNPHNPVVGIRSFGENPDAVARLGVAMIQGIQSQGVAATAKHFPGHGDTATDSHLGLPVVHHSLDRLRALEFVPFRACVQAGVKLVMTAHVGLPAVEGPDAPPATLSPRILQEFLRGEMGFEGLIITDALDMHAIAQGEALGAQAVKAAAAGADLLLLTSNPEDQRRVYSALVQAARGKALGRDELQTSMARVMALKSWLAQNFIMPDASVIGSASHLQVAREIAEGSVTLIRDHGALLPLHLGAQERIAVIVPRPRDLTPADTSSYVTPKLADALRRYHPNVDEFIIPHAPEQSDMTALLELVPRYDLIVIGTLNAFEQEGQSRLVRALLATGVLAVIVALRLPYDLASFPEAPAYLCTYSLLEPSMRALARLLFGQIESRGRLPVSIPGLYPIGHSFRR